MKVEIKSRLKLRVGRTHVGHAAFSRIFFVSSLRLAEAFQTENTPFTILGTIALGTCDVLFTPHVHFDDSLLDLPYHYIPLKLSQLSLTPE
jgi:hypothetical protein